MKDERIGTGLLLLEAINEANDDLQRGRRECRDSVVGHGRTTQSVSDKTGTPV